MKTIINNSDVTFQNDNGALWQCRNPLQAAKHVPTWEQHGMPRGDVAAISDCAQEYQKRGGTVARRATFSWKYENGVAVETKSPTLDAAEPVTLAVAAPAGARWRDYIA